MASRLSLQTMLEEILGSRNVYFQPPETIHMNYPAIVYSLNTIANKFADDSVYHQQKSYSITLIDKDPEHSVIETLSKLNTCRFDRRYVSDNLYHTTFVIQY